MEKHLLIVQIPETVLHSVLQLATIYTRRLERLLRQFTTTREYNPETVHQIRILTRKCSMAWRIIRHAGIKLGKRKATRTLSALRGSLGELRDADTVLEKFYSFAAKRKPGMDDALAGLLTCVWSQCYEKARKQVNRSIAVYCDALDALSKQCRKMVKPVCDHRWSKQHVRWAQKQLKEWSAASEVKEMDEERMHAFRIKTKRLRYLLQYLLPRKLSSVTKAWFNSLEGLQDELGMQRDLQNIVNRLDRLQKEISPQSDAQQRLINSAKAWRKACEMAIRRHNKQWERLRQQLLRSSIHSS